ncbi:MAG: HAD family hydrolase [Ruminiclostridium sp.]|nr:HAD family hydrolase [Ruminiclostridium sp.]
MNFTSKRVILFDLDGTLTDSGEGIINSLKYTLTAYGISDYDEKMVNRFIGPPLIESLMEIFGFDELKAREAVEKYREYFREIGIFENRLYNGIELLLKSLAAGGRRVILATSKAEVFAVRILEHFKISQYFWAVAGSELDGTRIKKSEVIRYALEKAGEVELSSAVMVGDREHDVFGAKQTGIDSIGVLYGYGNHEELGKAGASMIIETVGDLHKALLG